MSSPTSVPDPDETVSPDVSANRSPVEQLVELCVYAPIGLALDARSILPGLVERGRQQVGVARMVGEFAVKWGSVQLEAKVGDAQDQAMGLLRATGLAPVDERHRGATAPEQPGDDDGISPDHTASDADDDPASDAEPTPDPVSPDSADPSIGEAVTEEEPAVDVTTLAIPDYDNLSASQVVPRLDGLTGDELEAVGQYESTHRSRNTILNKVAQLQDGQ